MITWYKIDNTMLFRKLGGWYEISIQNRKIRKGDLVMKKFVSVVFSLVVFSCVGLFVISLFIPDRDEVIVVDELATTTPIPVEIVETTSLPEPTHTPEPTNTPIPTSTPDPNFVSRGTYIVNVDIEPGIYRGMAGVGIFESCYWGRLKDLSGELSGILANDNAQGQFYVEVTENDFAFSVRCDVWRLDSIPDPVSEFPNEIDVGMYLVGIDISPGLYQGKAGDDILESCYWQRMSDVLGTFGSIIANDNATGQYYVHAGESDFALQTSCPLVLVSGD
jgi:hypothetical protein